MNNEIKEILDFIKEQIEEETLNYEPDVELSKEEAKQLLDYITNLQEENKHIFANVNDDELLISNAMNYAEAQDYKSRCEKAIEYIKNTGGYIENIDRFRVDVYEPLCKDLLNILKENKDE